MRYRVFPTIILAFALLFPDSRFAAAQSIHPVDLDGTIVNFVVPEGYCALDESRPDQSALIDLYNPADGPGPMSMLFFINCGLLTNPDSAPFMTASGSENIGFYAYFSEWTELLEESNATRDSYIAAMETFFGDHSLEWFGDDLKARFAASNDRMTSAMLVYPKNLGSFGSGAMYGLLRIESFHSGNKSLFGGTIADTMIHHRSITAVLLRRIENANEYEALVSETVELMSAFLAANPDSDN